MISDIWLNLTDFEKLFFYIPSDLRAAILVALGFLLILATKRIFLG